ncbi:MAG: pyruvate ferredoxin oxidoreductase [Planctomycetes bacterium]|nr:pyruvate ferredoxin oxidoreductase [Planctomycetota bacterium]NOG53885.1 pyruvate ferredoxin oxidoreductase [Planctomycetota bacterium]
MGLELVTGNHAAGYALAAAGEANRSARGTACGIYPITPQTEIVEFVSKYKFTKGRVIPVESEHSAMGVSLGASLAGARSFTASSSNGLAYMFENIMVAGFYRLPIVLTAVNRTLGPPWNIWADQGDTLMLRDFPWLQFYCETNQEVVDSTLLAFRVSEDRRVLLPSLVIMDAFIMSHTQMETDLPAQELVDAYLPTLNLPHQLNHERPTTIGGLAWPQETLSQRVEVDRAMLAVNDVYEECRQEFITIFDRDPGAPIDAFETDDADLILITSGTIASTAREVVRQRRRDGMKIGLIKMKMFRPFPADDLLRACENASRIGVLDRNYAAGMGGVFWHDTKAAFQGQRDNVLIQDYLTGVCGGDVTPAMVNEVIDDLAGRTKAERPMWKGIEA